MPSPMSLFMIYVVIGLLLIMPPVNWIDRIMAKDEKNRAKYEALREHPHSIYALLFLSGIFWLPIACSLTLKYFKKEEK